MRDDRKARGFDARSAERKTIDFPAWADGNNEPETGDFTSASIPATVTGDGKQRYINEPMTGAKIKDDAGDFYIFLLGNVAGKGIMTKQTPVEGTADYGFLMRIAAVPESFDSGLIGAIIGVPHAENLSVQDGDWFVYEAPDQAFIQQSIEFYTQMGFALEPIGLGIIAAADVPVEIKFV